MRSPLPPTARIALGWTATASAQRFNDVAREASEVPGEIGRFAAPFFRTCDGSGAERQTCERHRRRDIRALKAGRWLLSVPAAGHVEAGPYEHVREGLLMRVADLILPAEGGLLTTRAPQNGVLARYAIGERFYRIPPDRAQRWFNRNSVQRMQLRVVFRFGAEWTEGDQRGVVITPMAVQVFNNSTGNVMIDSVADPEVPAGGPALLHERVMVWDRSALREARWRAPDGTPLLFSVRVEHAEGDGRRPILLLNRTVQPAELRRFEAPCCTSSLALIPRGENGVLVVFTERRPAEGDAGHGEVHLYEWRNGNLVHVTEWAGSNNNHPPAWIVDPNAPVN